MSLKVYTNNTDEYPTYEKNSYLMMVDTDHLSDGGLMGTLLQSSEEHSNDIGYSSWNPSFFCPATEEFKFETDEFNFTNNRLYVKGIGDKKDSIIDFTNGKIILKEKSNVKLILRNK